MSSRLDDAIRLVDNRHAVPPLWSDAVDEQERRDNLNVARLMEMQRLLLPITTARWVVLHTPESSVPFVLPDTGYVLGGPRSIPNAVLTVPIAPHTAVTLAHQWWRAVADGSSKQWRTKIEHLDLTEQFAPVFNLEAARACEKMIIADAAAVMELASGLKEDPQTADDCLWLNIIERSALYAMELDWFKLVCTLARFRPGDRRAADFERDPTTLSRFASQICGTVDRPMPDHIALGASSDHSLIYSCMAKSVDLSDLNAIKIAYAEGAPINTIRGLSERPSSERKMQGS